MMQLAQHLLANAATADNQPQALPCALPAFHQQSIELMQGTVDGFMLMGNVTRQSAAIVLAEYVGVTLRADH